MKIGYLIRVRPDLEKIIPEDVESYVRIHAGDDGRYSDEDLEFPTHINTRTMEFTPKHADHDFMQYLQPGHTPTDAPMRERVQQI